MEDRYELIPRTPQATSPQPTPQPMTANIQQATPVFEGDRYEMIPRQPQAESLPHYLGRTALRTGARAIETVLGGPGDFAKALLGGANYLAESGKAPERQLTPQEIQNLGGLARLKAENPQAIAEQQQALKQNIEAAIPGREFVNKWGTQSLVGQAAQPKTQGEKSWDEFVSDATNLFTAGGTRHLISGAKPITGKLIGQSVGFSALGNIGKMIAKKFGVGEGKAEAVKLGLMLPAVFMGSRNALKKQETAKYGEAADLVKGKTISNKNILKEAEDLSQRAAKGGIKTEEGTALQKAISEMTEDLAKTKERTGYMEQIISKKNQLNKLKDEYKLNPRKNSTIPRKIDVLKDELQELKTKYNNKDIPFENILEAKKKVNSLIEDAKLAKNTKVESQLKRLLGPIKEEIERFGRKKDPIAQAFKKAFDVAEELHIGSKTKSAVTEFLERNSSLKKHLDNPVIKALFKGGMWLAPGKTVAALGAATVGTTIGKAGLQASKIWDFIQASPIARKYYLNAIRNALIGDTKAVGRDLQNLTDTIKV